MGPLTPRGGAKGIDVAETFSQEQERVCMKEHDFEADVVLFHFARIEKLLPQLRLGLDNCIRINSTENHRVELPPRARIQTGGHWRPRIQQPPGEALRRGPAVPWNINGILIEIP